jgi:hypothetical protein
VTTFLPALELCRLFFEEAVRPLLTAHFPNLSYAAARIGSGSDVLGFDTAMSMDHDWGPQLQIFLREQDLARMPQIDQVLRQQLPQTIQGFPVGMRAFETEPGTLHMDFEAQGPVNHRIVLTSLRDFLQRRIDYDLEQPFEIADWLSLASQELLALTAGAIYHDGVGELTRLRAQLAWYPHDLWLYLLACGWQRIGQEEHLMPRAGFVGDELGSALIGSRLVRDIMNLCFLMEKRYAPYPKWFGTAFKQLTCAAEFEPFLRQTQIAPTWQEREAALSGAYELLARKHNALGLTKPLPEQVSAFYDRPFKIIQGEAFVQAILEQITNPQVQHLAFKVIQFSDPGMPPLIKRRLIGNIDQFSDSTDLRSGATWRATLRQLYE